MMVGAWAARWLLTAVFAAACLGSVPTRGRAATAPVAGRISDVFHVLMCAALIAMTWRSEPTASAWFQTALFGCAVIWFGLASPGGIARSRAGRLPGLHHALMAGTMIWMITAMPAARRMMQARPARSAMPAMPRPAAPGAVLIVSVLLVAYFALATVPWLALAVGPGPRVNDRAAAGHAAMSAGMAAMLLAML
jgi:Domain of unknown function (DUF5134)